MELRRAVDTALRLQPPPSFLHSPTAISRRQSIVSTCSRSRPCANRSSVPLQNYRSFASSQRLASQATAAAPSEDSQTPGPPRTENKNGNNEIHNDMVRRLQRGSPTDRQQSSLFPPQRNVNRDGFAFLEPMRRDGRTGGRRQPQPSNRAAEGGSSARRPRLGLSDLIQPHNTPQIFSKPGSNRLPPGQRTQNQETVDYSPVAGDVDPESNSLSNAISNFDPMQPSLAVPEPPPMQLGSSVGRSIKLKNPGDLSEGLRRLNILVATNRIRKDFNMQKFHERPGLKRKRLKSERWRRKFRTGWKHMCSRVSELQKQGW